MMKSFRSLVVMAWLLPGVLLFAAWHSCVVQTGGSVVSNLLDDTTSGNGCSLRDAIDNANDNAATHADCAAGMALTLSRFV